MKKMKAILSVLLCLLMVWACFAPASAVAAEGSGIAAAAKAPRLLNDDGNAPAQEPDWASLYPSLVNAANTLFFSEETEVDISALQIPYTEGNAAKITDALSKVPQLLCISGLQFAYTTNLPEGETSYITKLTYTGNAAAVAENKAKRDACEEVMGRLLFDIPSELDGYGKCLLLHDRLAAWAEYDQESFEANEIPLDSYSAYGALVNRTAVCRGYSMAYAWMLDKLGIESVYEISDELSHGWTKVKLDGEWYYVDVTYDDPVRDVPGRVLHDNLLIPFSVFKANHENKDDYDQSVTAETYVDSFDKNSGSEIVYLHGNYYYLKYSPASENDAQQVTLVRRSGSSDFELTLATVNTRTYNKANGIAGYHPKMTAIGDQIFYTDGKILYSFDVKNPGNEPVVVYTLENSDSILKDLKSQQKEAFLLQGLKQIDGKLYITAFNDEVFDADTVEKYTVVLDYCAHENAVLHNEVVPENCTQTGYKQYFCEDCRRLWKDDFTTGEHNLVLDSTTPANCISPAIENYKCTNTGCTYTESRSVGELDSTNHAATLETHPATNSTCKTQGYSEGQYCPACHKYTEGHQLQPLDPTKHENAVVTKEAFPATCTTDGWTQEVKCLACGETVSASVTLGKKGHSMKTTVVAPTCTTRGYTLHKCENCPLQEKTDFVEPLNHPEDQRESVPAFEGSCIEDAYEAGIYCHACNTYIRGHYSLGKNKNKHVGPWEEGISAPATCTVDGYTNAKRCTACGAIDKSGADIQKAPGHTWNDGVLVTEPTCTETGKRKYTCTVCGSTYVDVLDKLGHLDLDSNEICDRCDKNLNKDACPYCNQIHTGLFAPLTNFFHKILYLFFGAKKAK